ncbi:MAG: LLM class flavin-dependent oxidoreductase, partial [Candidatus Limnocylindrales bacterium]
MRYGIVLSVGDARTAGDLAAAAEAAGWDGVFTFDAVAIGSMVLDDPWVVLAAMALRTERVTLGGCVGNRHPWRRPGCENPVCARRPSARTTRT